MTINYKQLNNDTLRDLFGVYKFKLEPMWHQYVSLAFAVDTQLTRIPYFHDVGTGKTITALYTAQHIWRCKKILVICPESAYSAWSRDIAAATDYSYQIVEGSGKQRRAILDRFDKDVYIIRYEGLKTVFADLNSPERRTKKTSWQINTEQYKYPFDCIILDEVHRCKDYRALQSKICLGLSMRTKHVIGLTGTPIDKSMLELFNIYKVIDLGRTLGNNFFLFREMYFYKYGFEYKLKTGAKSAILERLGKTTISFNREECFDLPDLQVEIKTLPATEEQLKLEKQLIEDAKLILDNQEYTYPTQSAIVQKLMQLPSGFVYYKMHDNNDFYQLKENKKIEALLDIIANTSLKIIVYYKYTADKVIIENSLQKNKIKYAIFSAGQSAEERDTQLQKFNINKNVQILLAQTSIANEGFDGTAASIVVFYTPVASPKLRRQCIGRIDRRGQTKKTLVIDLIINGLIDEKIWKDRNRRVSLVTSVMEYIQKYKAKETNELRSEVSK